MALKSSTTRRGPRRLDGKTIAILGYGSQGHAHARNLKSSGVDVVVGLAARTRRAGKAERAGFGARRGRGGRRGRHHDDDAARRVDGAIYRESVAPNLQPGKLPRGGARAQHPLRRDPAARGRQRSWWRRRAPGIRCAPTTRRAAAFPPSSRSTRPSGDTLQIALAYAAGIGAGAPGSSRRTFREETETDLFGEQTVLCGGLVALMTALRDARRGGYSPEMPTSRRSRGEAESST